ncbi:MAG: bifunctional metallophosphatase/5'-nucleotidase [Acidobacteriota bacterium]|nr:bifunctional metallophosphatase/5'-nucleotidase [Acidobacteriota bacterium]
MKTLPVLCIAALLAWPGCASRTPANAATAAIANIQILGFNDFHGALDPPSGANGRIGNVDAGGAEFFAAHLARLKAENPNTIVVSAGDNIGASPLLSGMFHDEPTVEALGAAGLQISTVGNHEFDEGWEELSRLQKGGCHPVDGCQDKTPFAGARFEFLSANVVVDPGSQTLFPATTVRVVDGVKVGFIGLALRGTPSIVLEKHLRGLTFRPEVEAGNEAAASLVAQGVKTIVVMIHAGGRPGTADVNGCDVTGAIVDIANRLSPDIDVIVSGHTHRSYVCTFGTKLVTSAETAGSLITDIDLSIDRATGDVVSKRARNVIVTRDIAKSAAVTRLLDQYRPFYTVLGLRKVGSITAPILEAANAAGESPLGDVIADAILEQTSAPGAGGAQVALWNTGGIRADLVGEAGAPGRPATVTFSHAFDVLPFGNRVEVRTITGATLIGMLGTGVFQVSRGLSFAYDSTRPRGQRVDGATVRLWDRAIDPAASIRVAASDYIWTGGDGVEGVESKDPIDVGADIDMFVAYLEKHSPVAPGPQDRITRRK